MVSYSCLVCGCVSQEEEDELATLPLKLGIPPVIMGLVATEYWEAGGVDISD